ncbi:hypothetical protein CYMTET_43060 [Cymbomonas tetramitiformis]|uniref:Uncharacterized protein n=1 Tax=Cymbomonas tetramitiformis TaxID=36881 RepID=A0AAE0C4T6_9CHLO|nr:hypothetical protein CYMTET_43060 [Cymbomonas tetramitiformis]
MDTNPMVQVGTSVEKLPTTQRTDGNIPLDGDSIIALSLACGLGLSSCALRPSVATANCEATSSASGILTEEQVAVISEKADALLDIPLLPSGLKAVLLMQAVKTVSLQLDRRLTHEQRQRVQALDVGAVPPEDFVEELVVTLRGAIDIPILDQPMEDEVLRVVLKAMLADQSVSSQVASSAAKSTISAFRALKDPRSREALVARLNKAVDLPLLDEEQEQALFNKVVDIICIAIDAVIPASWMTVLQSSSKAELDAFSEYLVQHLQKKLEPVRLLSAEQTHLIARFVVDAFLGWLVEGGVVEECFSNNVDKLRALRQRERDLESELEAYGIQAIRRGSMFLRQLSRVQDEKRVLKEQMSPKEKREAGSLVHSSQR